MRLGHEHEHEHEREARGCIGTVSNCREADADWAEGANSSTGG